MTIKDCPRIKCPQCHSTICSAVGVDKKIGTLVNVVNKANNIPIKDIEVSGDYILRCNKCGKLISIEHINSGIS